jgi:hypothetical protein
MLTLPNLRRKPDYWRHDGPEWVRKIWPRPESFHWFIKSNRDALLAQGAVVRLGRDYFIDAQAFPPAAEAILATKPAKAGTA